MLDQERRPIDALDEDAALLSRTAQRFRAYVAKHPGLLARKSYPELSQPHPLLQYPLHPWPTFISRHVRETLATTVERVATLLRRAPRRLYVTDRARFHELFGSSPATARAIRLLERSNDAAHAIGRGDFYLTARGFQCLEFNFAGAVGGWELPFMADRVLSGADVRRFVDSEGLTLERPAVVRPLFRHILSTVPNRHECTVAFWIEHDREDAELIEFAKMYIEFEANGAAAEMATPTPRIVFATATEFARDGATIFVGENRIDAIVDVAHPLHRSEALDAQIEGAIMMGGALITLNGPATPLLLSKLNLALVSEAGALGQLPDEEAEAVRLAVPWTRVVDARSVPDPDGKSVPLMDTAFERQVDAVLKPVCDFGGHGVVIGKETEPSEWRSALAKALDQGGWIVQQYIEPVRVTYQAGECGVAPHAVVWGAFIHGARYVATFLRMLPEGSGRVVSTQRGSIDGVVFEVED